ncbi:MAG: hypothetical protein HKO54_02095, partial [Flavobacteriaceae bacterium]|nr:hypothetical protein [Flavobacteriaceae bacterium]
MKKLLLVLCVLSLTQIHAQESKGFSIDFSGGVTAPLGDYQSYTKNLGAMNGLNLIGFTQEMTGKYQFDLALGYSFGSFGAAVRFGLFKHEISDLNYEVNIPLQLSGGGIDGLVVGLGPVYNTAAGDFNFEVFATAGLMNISIDRFRASYNGADTNQPNEILNTELDPN